MSLEISRIFPMTSATAIFRAGKTYSEKLEFVVRTLSFTEH